MPPVPCVLQTFELRISAPHELTVLQRLEDYRALRAANARFLGTVSQPVGPLEQEIMSGNRIYLQVRNSAVPDPGAWRQRTRTDYLGIFRTPWLLSVDRNPYWINWPCFFGVVHLLERYTTARMASHHSTP